jgi:nucleoside 2-deoxyribosyltransferase
MKIYVASSWRCERQPEVVAALRAAGHEVYDFKNPAPGQPGFGWKQVTPEPPPWSAEKTIEVLTHPVADRGFEFDMNALRWCDACVMVQPCGRSAALELGWACGAGKLTVALLADGQEPELMLKMVDMIAPSIGDVINYLESESAS